MTKTNITQTYQVGDTFHDAREGRQSTLTILDIVANGSCFQLHWAHMDDTEISPFVTGERLLAITGGAEPISRGNEPTLEEILEVEPERLIPAEELSARVEKKSDGSVEIWYFAWADAWGVDLDVEPRALLNEVKGRYIFSDDDISIAPAAAELICGALYPYRVAPDTIIDAYRVSPQRGFLERLRDKLLRRTPAVGDDPMVVALKDELQELAKAAPASTEDIFTDWAS